jgi:hypothetical protein
LMAQGKTVQFGSFAAAYPTDPKMVIMDVPALNLYFNAGEKEHYVAAKSGAPDAFYAFGKQIDVALATVKWTKKEVKK